MLVSLIRGLISLIRGLIRLIRGLIHLIPFFISSSPLLQFLLVLTSVLHGPYFVFT